MGRKTMVGMAAVLALLALGMTLVAQEIGTPTQQEPMEYSRPDYQPGMQQQLTPAQQRAREEELLRMDAACMRRMGMDDTMINRRRMLMSMEVNPLDPHAVLSLRQELDAEIVKLGRRAENAQQLIRHLYGTPTITVSKAMDLLGINYVPANGLITSLVNIGVLHEITGFQRNRIFIFRRYMDIFTDRV